MTFTESNEAATLAASGAALMALAFAASLTLCAWAERRGVGVLADFPGGALRHRVAVPLCGGVALWLALVAVFAAAALACAVGRPALPGVILRYVDGLWYQSRGMGVILGLSTAMMLAGLATDAFEPGWKVRIGLQVAAAAALAAFGPRVTPFWPFSHPIVSGLMTVLWVVALVNAFAFLDNMDGLAAGVGLIASLLFAATQIQAGGLFAPAALMVVAGGLGGVLVYNRYPARVFMGYNGSWFVGFLLAAITAAGTYYRYDRPGSRNLVFSPLLVMAVPFYESAVVLLIWWGERDQPFLKNPRHFSYRLREGGLSPSESVRLLLLVSLGAGLGSLLLRRLDTFGTAVLLAQTACLIGVAALVEASAIRRKGGP